MHLCWEIETDQIFGAVAEGLGEYPASGQQAALVIEQRVALELLGGSS